MPDIDAIAGGGDNGLIQLWDYKTLAIKLMLKGHLKTIIDIVALTGKKKLASGSWDKRIIIWNLVDGQILQQLTTHVSFVMALLYYDNLDTLVSCSIDRCIILVKNISNTNNG